MRETTDAGVEARTTGEVQPREKGAVVVRFVDHECTECGASNLHHKHDHETEGDRVLAYCPDCEGDTDHIIGGRADV
jgi:Zn finger protein HypA/HybF involved in hydrogenase expression